MYIGSFDSVCLVKRLFQIPWLYFVVGMVLEHVGALERNKRIFNQKEDYVHKLVDKVKLFSLWWLKANNPTFAFEYHS